MGITLFIGHNISFRCYTCIPATDKAVLTGDKLNKKLYQHHTGYIGNLKEVKYGTLMAEKSDFAMELAVKGMLPTALWVASS